MLRQLRNWRKAIFDRTDALRNYPRIGRIETSKNFPNKEFRSLLEGDYRIIYRIENTEIFIIQVFNTRQNPDLLTF